MKKKFFFAAVALVALASCANEEIIGDSPTPSPNNGNSSDAIVFNSGAYAITRTGATLVGKVAADSLGGKFYVTGFKGSTGMANASTVFDNYLVEWGVNTAGKTESNTSDWEYVGKTAPTTISSISGAQTIKYWDYSTDQYDFAAFSFGRLDASKVTFDDGTATTAPAAGKLIVTGIKPGSYAPSYTLWGDINSLRECYISDMVTAYRNGTTDPTHPYKKEVQLSFRKLTSKVRIALYETIPGYSVKDVKFYTSSTSPAIGSASATDATLFTPGGNLFNTSGKYTVTFSDKSTYPVGNSNYNLAHVAFIPDATTGSTSTKTFGALNYIAKSGTDREKTGTAFLGKTSNAPSFAGSASPEKYYKNVLPNEGGADLELRIDYTLESIDGSGEEIKIYGAKAFVPSIYAQWKPNIAYTYLFKISDNTNGWTDKTGAEPAGLYPITFDAVVVESEDAEQTTITTVATPSITTYQKGHDYSADNVYKKATDDIYAQVMLPGATESAVYTLATDLATKGKLYTVTVKDGSSKTLANVTEADVLDALNVNEAAATTSPINGRNEFILTATTDVCTVSAASGTFNQIPGVDGNPIDVAAGTAAKFDKTKLAAGYYAYVYDNTPATAPSATYIYTAQNLTSQPADWTTAALWYKDPDGATAISDGSTTTAFAAGIYYKKYTNLNRVYGVKVIKVE